MKIFEKLKSVFSGGNEQENEFKSLITVSRDEYKTVSRYFFDVKVSSIARYTDVVSGWPDKKKVDFILYCGRRVHDYGKSDKGYSSDDPAYQEGNVCEGYIRQLLKAKLIMDESDVERLIDFFALHKKSNHASVHSWPVGQMLNQVGNQYEGNAITPKIQSALEKLKVAANAINNNYYEKEKIKLSEKIDTLLFRSRNEEDAVKPTRFLGEDEFSAYVNAMIDSLPADEKIYWYQLVAKAQKASGGKPSKKYLDETKEIFKELGADKFKRVVNDWFVFLISMKEKAIHHTSTYGDRTYTHTSYEFLSATNTEALKGFVWMCAHFHDAVTVRNLANLAERSFRKIPGKGPAAAAIGNACLFTLYKSKGLDGIGQLSRLKLRIKQNTTQTLIEKYLAAAAEEQGISVHEIEDLAVEDFGLTDGRKEIAFDEYKAELVITGAGKSELNWYKADGTRQKSIPAFVKEKYAEKLKKLKDTVKQLDQTTMAQRDRIDRMLRTGRKWSFAEFQSRYLEHGLVSYFAKRIIWEFKSGNETKAAIWLNGRWSSVKGEEVIPAADSEISLWHPATHATSEIKAWREFLVEHKILQTVKQAFREVYILTDAEVRTKTYSNRMAAHVLKQHQFNVLAKTRGWKYSLLGSFDDGRFNEAAQLNLPEFGLHAEYWVNELAADDAFNDTGIWNYITTDQVRFTKAGGSEPLDLADIPAIPFSEVMRDVDLFVGVASVGNDPTWQDSGGLPAYRDYWTAYSFGDLSEVAKNRKEILSGLIPRLKINKVAEIKDKFVVVKGKLRTYKIHIGSTNILMEPNDQYLCIVPDRSQKTFTENLFIPFEGDSGMSVILSKAFLLADDDKITDPTITSQINRK